MGMEHWVHGGASYWKPVKKLPQYAVKCETVNEKAGVRTVRKGTKKAHRGRSSVRLDGDEFEMRDRLGGRLARADDQVLLLAEPAAYLSCQVQLDLAAFHAGVADRLRAVAGSRRPRQRLAIQRRRVDRRSRGRGAAGLCREAARVALAHRSQVASEDADQAGSTIPAQHAGGMVCLQDDAQLSEHARGFLLGERIVQIGREVDAVRREPARRSFLS